jgi:hypothetical protein
VALCIVFVDLYSMVRLTIWQMAIKTCHGQIASLLCKYVQ